jgi:oligopeptide/dipeptide ABC transporter ATP-binding protein
MTSQAPLLKATGLVKEFSVASASGGIRRDRLTAVDHVDLTLYRGETLGVVGESGCGKSTLGRCLTRLHDVTSGTIEFDGIDITHLSRRAMRPIRRNLQMVFQDPYDSLNPRRRIGDVIADPLIVHGAMTKSQVRTKVADLLEVVGLSPKLAQRYPHEFSGGQRQRIGIARALALEPMVVVADEPVSALDVSIQAQILNLFDDLQDQFDLTYIFIAHDLGVIRHMSDRIIVMYLGQVVEMATNDTLYAAPAHPYTRALLSSAPEIDDSPEPQTRERVVLQGEVPNPIDRPQACPFEPRCPMAQERCSIEAPALRQLSNGTYVSCHFA